MYGGKEQYFPDADDSPLLAPADKKMRTISHWHFPLLRKSRRCDNAHSSLIHRNPTRQSHRKRNEKSPTVSSICHPRPDAIITYNASNMVLAGHSDASYISETKACSISGGHFLMSNNSAITTNNGAVITIAQIIKSVISSAAEAELGALFINLH